MQSNPGGEGWPGRAGHSPFYLAELYRSGLQTSRGLERLGLATKVGAPQYRLHGGDSNAGQCAVGAVLIRQVPAQGLGVAAAEVEIGQRLGERPTRQSGIGRQRLVETIGESLEVEGFDVVVA